VSRTATARRKTLETDISVAVDLDGTGVSEVSTGIGFLDHLIESFAKHSLIDVTVAAVGDVEVDDHHTAEDTALVLGGALADALGAREGIGRFGDAVVPMDEALARAAVDVGGRAFAVVDLAFRGDRIGALSTQNVEHFVVSLAGAAGLTVHLSATGRNDHHIAEAAVKALARAIRAGIAPDSRRVGSPSTKGSM
jgi:imidazoleglycerol-phosphate dehydratase